MLYTTKQENHAEDALPRKQSGLTTATTTH